MRRVVIRALGLVAALSLLAPTPLPAADNVTWAGTIKSVSADKNALVIEDVGPWVEGVPSPVTPRTIVLTPSTEILEVRRARDSDSGFSGDYKTTTSTRFDLVEGVFVSVECAPAVGACRALQITLVRTDSDA